MLGVGLGGGVSIMEFTYHHRGRFDHAGRALLGRFEKFIEADLLLNRQCFEYASALQSLMFDKLTAGC